MTTFALVLASAALHAVWNLLLKRVEGGIVFAWLFSFIGALVYLPFVAHILITDASIVTPLILGVLVINSLLHLLYYWLLSRGYQVGDLSLVYPLARGTGPLLATIGAILLLSERPSISILIGAVLVSLGVVILTGNPLALGNVKNRPAITYGLLVGVSIAAYTLWDRVSVHDLLIPPLLVIWVSTCFRLVVLTPHTFKHWAELARLWQQHKREAFGIGILDTLGYFLFLVALQTADVSLLSPLRQTSILFGALLGTQLLGEAGAWRRSAASAIMVVGVVAVALQL
jgi:uncharacterized membrane protein